MKILWLSNRALTQDLTSSTGSWLQAMSAALSQYPDVQLYNITFGKKKDVERCDCGDIQQWIVPKKNLVKGEIPQDVITSICDIINQVNPDLVHIWGVEHYWALLSARGYIKYPVLLEIQGLNYTCAEAYYGGLTAEEIKQCIRLRDYILPRRRIENIQRSHEKWGVYEKEMLAAHKYISTQSEWVRAEIAPYCNANAHIFHTRMAVRAAFMNASPWNTPTGDKIQLLSVSSGVFPYKGVHIAIKALAILKQYYPDIQLKIAGNYQQNRRAVKKHGYVRFLERTIQNLGLEDNIVFVGSLNTNELLAEMKRTNVMIHSSFVESYSLVLAEAMAVGVPGVISYAGAMSELAQDGVSGLFYSSADYRKCAYQVRRLIEDKELSRSISSAARCTAMERNNIQSVVTKQLSIYNDVLSRE